MIRSAESFDEQEVHLEGNAGGEGSVLVILRRESSDPDSSCYRRAELDIVTPRLVASIGGLQERDLRYLGGFLIGYAISYLVDGDESSSQ